MNKLKLLHVQLLLGIWFSLVFIPAYAQSDVIQDTVLPFFEALKTGDVQTIESKIDGNLYDQMIVLLRENETYPEFLRNRYGQVQFEVTNVDEMDKKASVLFSMQLPTGATARMNFQLIKNNLNVWKIVEQNTLR